MALVESEQVESNVKPIAEPGVQDVGDENRQNTATAADRAIR